MARLSDNDKGLILADFHTGQFVQRELAKKYEVSTATINKLTKGVKPKHEDKVNAVATAHAQLEGESEQEVNAVHKAIEVKTNHIKLIMDNAEKLASKLNTMTDQIDEPQDLKYLVEANDKLSITMKVSERHAPKTEITNTNATQNNTKRVTIARRSDRRDD